MTTDLATRRVESDALPDTLAVESQERRPRTDRSRILAASVAGSAIGSISFLTVLWNFGVRPFRVVPRLQAFGGLYDVQSRAFLNGDLAVPGGSLGIEAFRQGDREYLYFGPLPALLRIPALALTDALDGRLTGLSMLAAWVVMAVVTALLIWRVRSMTMPDHSVTRLEQVAVAGLIASVTGGSAVLHLAAVPWIYSEALLWAVAMAIGALYASVGVLQQPSAQRLTVAGAFILGAVLTRVTAGWGVGVTLAAIGIAFATGRRFRVNRRWALPTIFAASVPLLVGIAINWAKFRHAFLIPFDDQIWTDRSWRRQRVLREGGVEGVRFIPSTLYNYLRPWGIRISPVFPFIASPAEPAQPVGGVFLEMPYQTPSATSTMPVLFVLSGFGLVSAFRRGATDGFRLMRIPLFGGLSIVGGVLMVGYITPRYLAEFMPFLTLASVIGTFSLLRRSRRRTSLAMIAAVTIGFLAASGATINLAVSLTAARVGAGGLQLFDYVAAQNWVSERTGHPMDSMVEVGDELPVRSQPGQVYIYRDCGAMYYGTGDLFEPWVLVDFRDLHVRIRFDEQRLERAGRSVPIARFDGIEDRSIVMEFDLNGKYRLVLAGSGTTQSSLWRSPGPDEIDIWIVAQLEQGTYLVGSPGHLYTTVAAGELASDLRLQPTYIVTNDSEPADGFDVLIEPESASGLCRDLVDRT